MMMQIDQAIRIVFPPPISVNALYRNLSGKGRVKTGDYKAWLRNADDYLRSQSPLPAFQNPVTITYFVGEKGVGNMDWGNTEKAMTDALVSHHILRDDNRTRVHGGSIFWVPNLSGVITIVEPSLSRPDTASLLPALTSVQRDLIT